MNMNWIKRICTGLAIAVLLALATACSSLQPPQDVSTTTPTSPPPKTKLALTGTQLATTPTSTTSITVNAQSILQIQGTYGNITVEGGNTNTVTVTANGKTLPLSQRYNVISPAAAIKNASINVTVPSNINLNLTELHGAIDVKGVRGEMKLTTQDGNITVSQSTQSGQSTFKSTSGAITFSGSLYANGNTSLKTDKGGILITLPANATFHVDATVQQGNITSAFPLTIKSLPNGGSQVNQDRGAAQPKLTLEVNQGYINLQADVP